jgi:hypothetical protein
MSKVTIDLKPIRLQAAVNLKLLQQAERSAARDAAIRQLKKVMQALAPPRTRCRAMGIRVQFAK